VNLVLLDPAEVEAGRLASGDPRTTHVLRTLRRAVGDTFDCGVVDGPRGRATVVSAGADGPALAFAWGLPPPPSREVRLIVGLPRPQTARDILRDATTLGATRIDFVATERSDPSYASSTLWSSGEWRRHCLAGAAQAFDTRLPKVSWTHTLEQVVAEEAPAGQRVALDNYEAVVPFGRLAFPGAQPISLALGPERGWGPRDRDLLRARGWTLAGLGDRVLRLETAVSVALGIALSRSSAATD
jgi:16S rRNA (uracil1498-N3)-methyltransferase